MASTRKMALWWAVSCALSAVLPATGQGYENRGPLPDELAVKVYSALETCQQRHGAAAGRAFTQCVNAEAPPAESARFDTVLKEVIRNFSCSQDDPTPPVLRTMDVTVPAGYDACEALSRADADALRERPRERVKGSLRHPDFSYVAGALPAGDDVGPTGRRMTAKEAAEECLSIPECEGFTFPHESSLKGPAEVWFKSIAKRISAAPNWHTYRRQMPDTCSAAQAFDSEEARSYSVDILREQPLLAVIRNFAQPDECAELMRHGGHWDDMGRAYVSKGGQSQYRRSYSANIDPDLKDTNSELTRMVARMFAVTRNLTGYSVWPPGQEPVNAVLYKNPGDEYRVHCDGSCRGTKYVPGERVATGILYCHAPEEGGQTSFSVDNLKVVPNTGDIVLFAYKMGNGQMAGQEVEHSGCPLRKGRKWIATQWYRETLTEEWNWQNAIEKVDQWRHDNVA
ncbi:unnamed protein product [Polarella glacialis]|uniref:Fe2OG dioxygenase domain-containing protein n=1 Tax=Polarella glacialis TaxID=89957 RepID=A0A813KK83_POLGL|nr:unnamed protein product [Polarella glacialis]CAE8704857.1 unnamed protein product [Polarella glacialis]